jgi:hypothetical protein
VLGAWNGQLFYAAARQGNWYDFGFLLGAGSPLLGWLTQPRTAGILARLRRYRHAQGVSLVGSRAERAVAMDAFSAGRTIQIEWVERDSLFHPPTSELSRPRLGDPVRGPSHLIQRNSFVTSQLLEFVIHYNALMNVDIFMGATDASDGTGLRQDPVNALGAGRSDTAGHY